MLDHIIELSTGEKFTFYFRFIKLNECEVIDEDANLYIFTRDELLYEKIDSLDDEEIVTLFCYDTRQYKKEFDHCQKYDKIMSEIRNLLGWNKS